MKILGYRIVKESEYQIMFSAIQVAHRVGELQRWLNPWRMVYGNIFKFIQTGNTQVEYAREQILNDYMSVHREGVEKENADKFVSGGIT